MKKIIMSIALCFLFVLTTFSFAGCGDDKDKLVTAPKQSYIISCLYDVPGIQEVIAVTESTDPNNLLNKPGGYYASVYFSYSLVDQRELNGNTIIQKGVNVGGCVEVYQNKNDAEKRNNYLAAFDGTVLASGSHKVVGTVVVRTSNLLLASQQKLLESNIIAVLTGNPNDVNSNIGTPSFGSGFEVEDFESWITFPVIGSGGLDVEYFVHYQPKGEFAKYATLNIENFTYTYDDSQDGILKINFAITCFVKTSYNGDIGIEIYIYDNNDDFEKVHALGYGNANSRVTINKTISVDIDEAQQGINIIFSNCYDYDYWDDKTYNEDYFTDKYQRLIDLPQITQQSDIRLSYYADFYGNDNYAMQSKIQMIEMTYEFDDSVSAEVCVIYSFEALVYQSLDGVCIFNFAIYDCDDNLIRTVAAAYPGNMGDTISDYGWLTLYSWEIDQGLKIELEDYYYSDYSSDYDELIELPHATIDGYCSETVSYSSGYNTYSELTIYRYTYTISEGSNNTIIIKFDLDIKIENMLDTRYGFMISVYDENDELVKENKISGYDMYEDKQLSVQTSITVNKTDVQNGIFVSFNDCIN